MWGIANLVTIKESLSDVIADWVYLYDNESTVEVMVVNLRDREVKVLNLMAQGNSNKMIAQALGVKEQTVKNYTQSIFRELDVHDRTQAVVVAIRRSIIDVYALMEVR